MAWTQDNTYLSISTPLGKDKLLLRGFAGEERISELFHFNLRMQSDAVDLDFTQIVGKSATITLVLADGSKRYINGIVSRFVQAGADQDFATYHAELVPWLWLCDLTANCQIFQNQSTPDIIKKVFGDLGFTDFKDSLTGTYDPREYCVQYNETAFEFVSRLMEDEGIFYYFEHADGKHTLVLADDSASAAAVPGAATVAVGSFTNWEQQNVITRCELEQRVIPGKFDLDDFNFETPSTDLMSSVDSTVATAGSKRRIYEYPGGFLNTGKGESRAKLRIEMCELPAKTLRGDSRCRAFLPGYKFTLEKHYRTSANTDYVLAGVSHSATFDDYSNSFEAFPATVPYRPPRRTRKPVIPSTQTALVVGKSGEEIWTDKYGRVKVQFHWDQLGKKNEESSCWIRVAHGWAGKGWGQMFLPRIGQEVVVSFLEGDPDRPLITGSVYNAEQTVPYTLPADQTKSTVKSNSSKGGGGSNELRFEDKKGSEEVYFHAQKDHNLVIENDRKKEVKHDETNTVKNNRTTTIQEGNESLTVSKGNRTVKVDTGNETHEVKGTRTVKVTGDETHDDEAKFTHTVKGDYSLTINGKLTISVDGDITIKSTGGKITTEASQAYSNKAGTTFTNEAGTELTNKAGTNLTNKAGGGDLTNDAAMNLTNKAGMNMTNEAGISLTNKASASQTVDGGGMLTVKGGLVKIN
ncbi:MAG TPA: type VI secretion system tip protein TssI/VgrG [Thermoanaerobaculia bacterium]|jgi:type VI secretion system secreted protein VgrG|nr:type VI secretion system tip protein TssI/VgrG [Thermoanaerobaculia bacterium]